MSNTTERFFFLDQFKATGLTCPYVNARNSDPSLIDALKDPETCDFRHHLALNEGAVVAMSDAYGPARHCPLQLHSYAGLANAVGMMTHGYWTHRG